LTSGGEGRTVEQSMFSSGVWRKLFGGFFNPHLADETGLVAIGGDLSPRNIIKAYCSGVFPWFGEGDPIMWWAPDPRASFERDALRIYGRLRRTIGSSRFRLTMDRDFAGVMHGCADRAEGTWITTDMLEAYQTLHRLGYAHSLETWHEDKLAGGIYG